mgnify:FL=1
MYQSSKRSGKKENCRAFDILRLSGIESWVTGDWAAKQAGTQKYRDFMNGTSVKLHFIKVKGHTGVEGNERADSLAKEAVSEKISFNQL